MHKLSYIIVITIISTATSNKYLNKIPSFFRAPPLCFSTDFHPRSASHNSLWHIRYHTCNQSLGSQLRKLIPLSVHEFVGILLRQYFPGNTRPAVRSTGLWRVVNEGDSRRLWNARLTMFLLPQRRGRCRGIAFLKWNQVWLRMFPCKWIKWTF